MALQKNSDYRTAISGTVRVTQSLGGKSVTAPGVLLVEWPGRLRFELQDPVGSLLLLLVVDGDHFWLYRQNATENLTGPLAKLPSSLSLPFTAADLVRVFLARPPFEKFRDAKVNKNQADLPKEMIRWEEGGSSLQEWRIRSEGSVNSARYEAFEARSGKHFPTKIRLSSAGKGQELSALVVWDEWEPSVPGDKKLFQIPPSQTFGRPTKALP